MTERELAYGLTLAQSVVLDANGYGYVEFRPILSDWTVRTVAVFIPGTLTLVPLARTYIDTLARGNYLDATSTGNGDMSDTNYDIRDGHRLLVEWTGGDPGVTATATITYNATVYGRGFRAQTST